MTRTAVEAAIRIAETPYPSAGDRRLALGRLVGLLDPEMHTALLDVVGEALRAGTTHGSMPNDMHRRLGVLTEEVMELATAINDHAWKTPDAAAVRLETVQVAAVALRMIPAHDAFTITSTRTT